MPRGSEKAGVRVEVSVMVGMIGGRRALTAALRDREIANCWAREIHDVVRGILIAV